MKSKYQHIIDALPYTNPFLFVDTIEHISEEGVVGYYQFDKDSFFYKGHFKEHPVTPGVILTECMAQIGLVCLGIFLLSEVNQSMENNQLAFSESEVQYLATVLPGERVKVVSEKIYYRFGKLKCKVSMFNTEDVCVCKGVLSGLIQ